MKRVVFLRGTPGRDVGCEIESNRSVMVSMQQYVIIVIALLHYHG